MFLSFYGTKPLNSLILFQETKQYYEKDVISVFFHIGRYHYAKMHVKQPISVKETHFLESCLLNALKSMESTLYRETKPLHKKKMCLLSVSELLISYVSER